MTLRITSTLGGQKTPFTVSDNRVRMYVCGMTPKFHPHVGHARVFVAADIIRRWLEYRGYDVQHVQNFTDVDDKIIARARIDGITPEAAAERYIQSYFQVMDRLNVERAHEYPTVTGSMDAIIAYVDDLIEKGYAYAAHGDVYFAVAKFPHYGQLSGRATDEGQLVGARKDLEPGKRDPRDFALWKGAKPGEPAWASPWGDGRPGWHIECSAMVRETLGDQIDVHGGGRDLIFPHHENELAQSEAFTGVRPFARYWAHAGLVTTGTEKMAHSLENFTTIRDVLDAYDPVAIRLFLLQTHYRSSLLYTREALDNAVRALGRLRGALEGMTGDVLGDAGRGAPDEASRDAPRGSASGAGERAEDREVRAITCNGAGAPPAASTHDVPPWIADVRAAVEAQMDDDFNTPGALGALFDLVREINRRRDAGAAGIDGGAARADLAAGQAELVKLASLLGLTLEPPDASADGEDAGLFIDLLLATRQRLREAKQWQLADEIRDRLRDLGVLVEDRPSGAVWRREHPEVKAP